MKKQNDSEALQYFENLSTDAKEGIVLVDRQGTILKANPVFLKILVCQEEEILGKNFYNIIIEGKPHLEKFTSLYPLHYFNIAEKSGGVELTLYNKQGHETLVKFRSIIFRDEHNEAKQAIGRIEIPYERVKVDNEEFIHAEKIWEVQQNLESIINSSLDSIMICDLNAKVTLVNKAFLQMVDRTYEEVIGSHIIETSAYLEGNYPTTAGEEIFIDEEYVASIGSKVSKMFETGNESTWESYVVRKDNVLVPIEITLSFLKDKQGELRGSLSILRDITERKKTDNKLKNQRKKLDEMKNEFFLNISHDLRTPLTSIKGSLDNLLDGIAGDLNNSQKEYLRLINSESNRLVRLINNLLDLNKLEADAVNITSKRIEYISIVKEVIQNLKDFATKKGLLLNIKTDLPKIYLKADGDRINQILINLISNGINFTQQGEITVIIEDEDSQSVVTRIKDTGRGIPSDEQDKIFDKFYQLKRIDGEKYKGTGLGLAISKSFVELHGGRIWVESIEGKGSEFCFSLPKGG